MNISIGFSGAAGTGVNTSGMLLGELLCTKGYTILGDKEYASIIKGDNNNFFLYISQDKPFITKKIDHFFPFDDYSITKNEKVYDLKKIHKLKKSDAKYKNVYFFGASLKLLGIPCEEGEKVLEKYFKDDILAANVECIRLGYGYFKTSKYDLSQNVGPEKVFMFGNEIIGKGAIASGMDFYAAYPMTPASSLIEVITENKDVTFYQGEDEIACSIAMLGAKFAGKRAMTGTSGGGFALMTESISFSNIAELGGVYVLSQRDGPSTGTPTYTGQSDINYALNASFGDTFPIVLAPSTYEDGYTLIGKALNRSDQYQHPVIVLIDKQYSESYLSVDTSKLVAEPIYRGKMETLKDGKIEHDYKRYAFTADGISPVVVPGTENGEFIATSYEHDEYGATSEDPENKKLMNDKRFKKLETFVQQEFTEEFYGYEIINPEAKIFFVTFGMNRLVLEDYIRLKNGKAHIDTKGDILEKNGDFSLRSKGKIPKYGLIVLKVFQPLDMRLKEFLDAHVKQIKKLVFVEMNYSGQIQELITNKCLLNDKKWKNKIGNIRKVTSYPVFGEEIVI